MVGEEIQALRARIDAVDQEIQQLLAERTRTAVAIGRLKAERGLPARQIQREVELLTARAQAAEALGLDSDDARQLFELILAQSRAAQQRALAPREDNS